MEYFNNNELYDMNCKEFFYDNIRTNNTSKIFEENTVDLKNNFKNVEEFEKILAEEEMELTISNDKTKIINNTFEEYKTLCSSKKDKYFEMNATNYFMAYSEEIESSFNATVLPPAIDMDNTNEGILKTNFECIDFGIIESGDNCFQSICFMNNNTTISYLHFECISGDKNIKIKLTLENGTEANDLRLLNNTKQVVQLNVITSKNDYFMGNEPVNFKGNLKVTITTCSDINDIDKKCIEIINIIGLVGYSHLHLHNDDNVVEFTNKSIKQIRILNVGNIPLKVCSFLSDKLILNEKFPADFFSIHSPSLIVQPKKIEYISIEYKGDSNIDDCMCKVFVCTQNKQYSIDVIYKKEKLIDIDLKTFDNVNIEDFKSNNGENIEDCIKISDTCIYLNEYNEYINTIEIKNISFKDACLEIVTSLSIVQISPNRFIIPSNGICIAIIKIDPLNLSNIRTLTFDIIISEKHSSKVIKGHIGVHTYCMSKGRVIEMKLTKIFDKENEYVCYPTFINRFKKEVTCKLKLLGNINDTSDWMLSCSSFKINKNCSLDNKIKLTTNEISNNLKNSLQIHIYSNKKIIRRILIDLKVENSENYIFLPFTNNKTEVVLDENLNDYYSITDDLSTNYNTPKIDNKIIDTNYGMINHRIFQDSIFIHPSKLLTFNVNKHGSTCVQRILICNPSDNHKKVGISIKNSCFTVKAARLMIKPKSYISNEVTFHSEKLEPYFNFIKSMVVVKDYDSNVERRIIIEAKCEL